jgi:hypothetical protein
MKKVAWEGHISYMKTEKAEIKNLVGMSLYRIK